VPRWQNIDDVDADGDTTYLSADTADDVFTVNFSEMAPLSFPRPIRIPSITIIATVRAASVTPTSFQFRLRYLGVDYDSESFTITTASYVEQKKNYTFLPNADLPAGTPWNAVRANDIEVGLVYVSGVELRCTKLEIQVHTELFPHWTLQPDGDGFHNTGWTATPGVAPKFEHIQPLFDGDLSYLSDATATNIYTATVTNVATTLTPANIDRVQASALVKNTDTSTPSSIKLITRSGGTDRDGATSTVGHALLADSGWVPISESWFTEPSSGFPSGLPAASAWTKPDVDALEVGFETGVSGPSLRATSMSVEVWLKDTPSTTLDGLPNANGFHADLPPIVPNGGEAAWEDVDEVVPDDATTYIGADADAAGNILYGSFAIPPVGAIPGGERIFCVEVRLRLRLGATSDALIAPLVRAGGETYLGRPISIEGTGTTWFDVKEDFYTNPDTGLPWLVAEVDAAEYGMAILEGEVFLSRVRAQVQTAPDVRGTSSATSIAVTDGPSPSGSTIMTRSIGDGTIYAILEFGIGSGGYTPTDPKTAVAVVSTDSALLAEEARYPITAVTFDLDSSPQKVQYWCRVPKGDPPAAIGEVALYATFLSSPFPAEIGTDFMFAKMHIPAQTRHPNCVQLFVIEIEYP
jgi:hypothetical protein